MKLHSELTRVSEGGLGAALAPHRAIGSAFAATSPVAQGALPSVSTLDRVWPAHSLGMRSPLGESAISKMVSLSVSADLSRMPHLPRSVFLDPIPEIVDDESARHEESTRGVDEPVITATFEVRVPSQPLSRYPSHPQDSIQLMPNAVLTDLEQNLRRFVEKRLQSRHGVRWFDKRVPQRILKRWVARQEVDWQSGCAGYSLIEYSDFMDLFVVITEEGNWESTFEPGLFV
ncbi:MAG: hypothetical protein OXJ90_04710 [Spirochaetaceae bacterium]|nr:hypothetical protein [Spirochaetaceae bacterium]